MRAAFVALLLAAVAAGASAADGDERWIFVGSTEEVSFREDLEVELDDPNALFLGGVYEASFRVRRQLAGPPLPRRQRLVFIGGHMPIKVGAKRWFLVARRGEQGLYAGQNWQWLENGRLCLRPEDIAELGLEQHFIKARADDAGRRCIKV